MPIYAKSGRRRKLLDPTALTTPFPVTRKRNRVVVVRPTCAACMYVSTKRTFSYIRTTDTEKNNRYRSSKKVCLYHRIPRPFSIRLIQLNIVQFCGVFRFHRFRSGPYIMGREPKRAHF